jgi:hypothetical protein
MLSFYCILTSSFITALAGFASLLLVAAFEMDVAPERFLEDKLIVTGWLAQKLRLDHLLDFDVNDHTCDRFLRFLRHSPLAPLYEEDQYLLRRSTTYTKFHLQGNVWSSLHIVGATSYVFLVTAAVLVHDENEAKVAWITGGCFLLFCMLGYLTGNYVYVLRPLRGWILLWNPFVRDPHFMLHLKQVFYLATSLCCVCVFVECALFVFL